MAFCQDLARCCQHLNFGLKRTEGVKVKNCRALWANYLFSVQYKTMLNGRKNSNFLNLLYCEVTPWNGTTGDLPLIYVDFKSLVYSGTVDNLYLLDRLLVMYFSTPFLLQNRYWILRRLPASFIQTVTRSIYFYKKKESRQLSRNIK